MNHPDNCSNRSNEYSHFESHQNESESIKRVESFEEAEDEAYEEEHLAIPHLMMTYSSDDEEDYQEHSPSSSGPSSSLSCLETSTSSSSTLHLSEHPSNFSSPHLSSPSSPRHHYRHADTSHPQCPLSAAAHTRRHRKRTHRAQHVHRTKRRDHDQMKSEPAKKNGPGLRLQRTWHGGYDYSCSSFGTHTKRKEHKRCYSYNDAFVEPLEKNPSRKYVKLDSFNNLEEIFYNHYKNHPTSMSVSVDQRLRCDYPLQDQISTTHPLWRDEPNSPNDVHSISSDGDEHHSCSSSTNSFVRGSGVCHLRPILEPEVAEESIAYTGRSKQHQNSLTNPQSSISTISTLSTSGNNFILRKDSSVTVSSTVDSDTDLTRSSQLWNLRVPTNKELSELEPPYLSPEMNKKGWRKKMSKILWYRPKKEAQF